MRENGDRVLAAKSAVPVLARRRFSTAPLTVLSAEEEMIRDSAAKFAHSVIKPRVRQMDESMTMAPEVIKGLFENGVRFRRRSRRRFAPLSLSPSLSIRVTCGCLAMSMVCVCIFVCCATLALRFCAAVHGRGDPQQVRRHGSELFVCVFGDRGAGKGSREDTVSFSM